MLQIEEVLMPQGFPAGAGWEDWTPATSVYKTAGCQVLREASATQQYVMGRRKQDRTVAAGGHHKDRQIGSPVRSLSLEIPCVL